MKLINVPPKVTIKFQVNNGGVVTLAKEGRSFCQFIKEACGDYKKFKSGLENIRQYDKIARTLEAYDREDNAGTLKERVLRLEDADFNEIKNALKAGEATWASAEISRTFLPFYEALENAQEVEIPTGE